MIWLYVYLGGLVAWAVVIGFLAGFCAYQLDRRDLVLAIAWPFALPLVLAIWIGRSMSKQ